jgi:ComF family protein
MHFRLRSWSQHVSASLSALLPCACALCGNLNEQAVCRDCRLHFFAKQQYRCSQCALPIPSIEGTDTVICGSCLSQPPAFDATIVATDYAPPIDQLVLALKFGSQLALAPLFADMLHTAILQQHASHSTLPSRLIAVPLGAGRLAERGFNQAFEIAKPLARSLNITLHRKLIVRHRETPAQSLLHPDERHKNIRQAFTLSHHASMSHLAGHHIGVVDDVMTTGETLNELAATLKRFGATRVTNFVFARTPQKS